LRSAAGFRSPFFHRRLQSNAFNRADFCKSGAADDEACLVVFPVGRFCFGMFGVYQICRCFAMFKTWMAGSSPIKSGTGADHDELNYRA
jgi:hypothetical protein